MLEIKNLTKTFNLGKVNQRTILDDLSLKLNDGDFVTIIGSNGAGKSTLLNMIAGSYQPEKGSIIIDDIDVTKMSEYKRAKYIGRVFQDPLVGSATDMWIEENLALAFRRGKKRTLSKGIKKEEREFYKQALQQLDLQLEERLDHKVATLSGGQRQALTLLMATMQNPRILLLDEHTAALDPATSKKVLQLSDELIKKNHLTALMVTHNMADAIKYGNRLIMMDAGKIIFDVSNKEKEKLTVNDLIDKFNMLSKNSLSDEVLLQK